jgi:hypothetical protein
MDNGKGQFKIVEGGVVDQMLKQLEALGRTEATSGIFHVGEKLEIRGSPFVVLRITKHELHLKLLPRSQAKEAADATDA